MRKILSLVFTLFFGISLMAQAPQMFTIQSVLRDASGALVTSRIISVHISIHQASPTGTTVYAETHAVQTNENGLYTINVGTGTSQRGIFNRINWGNGPFFLQHEVDPDGGFNYVISATQQLLSVPYALYAENVAGGGSGGGVARSYVDSVVNAAVNRMQRALNDTAVALRGAMVVSGSGSAMPSGCFSSCNTTDSIRHIVDSLRIVVHRQDSIINVLNGSGSGSGITTPPTCPPGLGSTDVQSACGSFIWQGNTYTSSTTTPTYHFTTSEGCDSVVTLNLTIHTPQSTAYTAIEDDSYVWPTSGANGYGTGSTYTSSGIYAGPEYTDANGCTAADTLHLTIGGTSPSSGSPTDGLLSGEFSVSATIKVKFSQGNLQYQPSTNTWRLAQHQFDFVGNNGYGTVFEGAIKCSNDNISSTTSDWLDLFGWGTSGWSGSGATAYMPYSTSQDATQYQVGGDYSTDLTSSFANADWGVHNAISNGGNAADMWRTLTYSEWKYILYDRSNAAQKKAFATIVVNVNEAPQSIKGLLLLPDDWTLPSGCSFTAYSGTQLWTQNNYNEASWALMQAAGAVFLPIVGYRGNLSGDNGATTYIRTTDYHSKYWTASQNHATNAKSAYQLMFYNGATGSGNISLSSSNNNRTQGSAVRLVRTVVSAGSGGI